MYQITLIFGCGSMVDRRFIVDKSLIELTWTGPTLIFVGCGSSDGRRIIVTSWNGPTLSCDVGPSD